MSLESGTISELVSEQFGRIISHDKITTGRLDVHTFRIHLSDYYETLQTVENPNDMQHMIPSTEAIYNDPKDRTGNKLTIITKKDIL